MSYEKRAELVKEIEQISLQSNQKNVDLESLHSRADEILLELIALTDPLYAVRIRTAFSKMIKWYA